MIRILAVTALVAALGGEACAREAFSNPADVGKRVTRGDQREDRQKKAADEAKKKADEQKRDQERQQRRGGPQQGELQRGMTVTGGNRGGTSSTANARGGNKAGGKGAAQAGYGQSAGEASKEVTDMMLNAVKTQRVRFDPAQAEEEGLLLLNEPVFKKESGSAASVVVQPL